MRESDRRADCAEKLQAVRSDPDFRVAKIGRSASLRHIPSRDTASRRRSFRRRADARYSDARARREFAVRARNDGADVGSVQLALDELDGDLLFKFSVGSFAEINRAHSAAPDFADDAIRAEASSFGIGRFKIFGLRALKNLRKRIGQGDRRFDKMTVLFVGPQSANFAAQTLVAGAQFVEPRLAFAFGQIGHLRKYFVNFSPDRVRTSKTERIELALTKIRR